MKNFKLVLFVLFNLLFFSAVINATVYNQDGDFGVNIGTLSKQIYNNNISATYSMIVQNKLSSSQKFSILIPSQSGWDINVNSLNFVLAPNASKNISINFRANNKFVYSNNVVGPNVVQIAQKNDYTGDFNFPLTLMGANQNVSLSLNVKIDKKPTAPISFLTKVSTEPLSPQSPLRFSIKGDNLVNNTQVFIRVELSNRILKEFSDNFSPSNNFKFYQESIPANIDPGTYDSIITIRIPQKDGSVMEWNKDSKIQVVKYDRVLSNISQTNSILKDTTTISLKNVGNENSNYVKSFKVGAFSSYLVSSNQNFQRVGDSILFNVSVNRGESKTISYSVNYISLYILLLIIIIILSYVYIRKNSNPLDVETSIYDIKKVVHEGVKDLKIRIGFENIKEAEIEDLKIIFRMPSYLNIKDGSFSLTEPNHVLKGKKQFKLIWNFKRFEKEDSRILGFALINPRGILGDIKLPDLEIEVKINGKLRTYYKSFPIIRG